MKKTDIKRIERAIKYYAQAEKALEEAYESIYDGDTEYLPNKHIRVTTDMLVRDLYDDTKRMRKWMECRLDEMKELAK